MAGYSRSRLQCGADWIVEGGLTFGPKSTIVIQILTGKRCEYLAARLSGRRVRHWARQDESLYHWHRLVRLSYRLSLEAPGFDVAILERNPSIHNEASGNNQFRLDMRFHYRRHHTKRVQCRDGFIRFVERYPELSKEIPHNIYAVPREESLSDFPPIALR